MKTKIKDANSGITLIALVVTIIVLLILARSINNDANRRQPEYLQMQAKQVLCQVIKEPKNK